METEEQIKICKAAIYHVLNAICDDPRKYYLMGEGTGSYAKLIEAMAALWGKSVNELKESYVPDQVKYLRYVTRVEEEDRLLTYCRENGIKWSSENPDKTLLIQRNQLRYYLATMMERKAHPFEEAEQVAIEKLLEETKG